MFFEDMDITYLGPVDGHDVKEMVRVFNEAKRVDHAVLVHVLTKKEKGIFRQRKIRQNFMGQVRSILRPRCEKNQKGRILIRKYFLKCCLILQKDERIVAITAAMADGTGLTPFAKHFPNRFFDVGIAEEHAMTFAAGLAAGE